MSVDGDFFPFSLLLLYACILYCPRGLRKRIKETYQSTFIAPLGPILQRNELLQRRNINLGGRNPHDAGALGEHVALEIEGGEVQTYQERGGLGLADLVREEVRDGVGDARGVDVGVAAWPELLEEGLDVDAG